VKKIVYLSLGSNLGDRQAQLEAAIGLLSRIGTITAASAYYETEPTEVPHQPWFLNSAVALETELMPRQLLSATQAIEHQMGRRREKGPAKGPRVVDIDILLFGNSQVDTKALTIPHPALHRRRFVLEPLAEIAPDVRHPVFKQTMRELRDALPASAGAVKRISPRKTP
jgi:2-amino-4-hydroxy-6-hydroxymethyldihydropteridine diphosphokinase